MIKPRGDPGGDMNPAAPRLPCVTRGTSGRCRIDCRYRRRDKRQHPAQDEGQKEKTPSPDKSGRLGEHHLSTLHFNLLSVFNNRLLSGNIETDIPVFSPAGPMEPTRQSVKKSYYLRQKDLKSVVGSTWRGINGYKKKQVIPGTGAQVFGGP
jgi:hypothetical protein